MRIAHQARQNLALDLRSVTDDQHFEFVYNSFDVATTVASYFDMAAQDERALAAFDHALMGPALTMGLRGLRVDEAAAAEALEETWDETRKLRRALDQLCKDQGIEKLDWERKACKPSPHQLKRLLFTDLKAPIQSNRDGGLTTNKEALDKILNHSKSSDEAAEAARLALELSRLDEDRKVIEKPRGKDGRMHTGFGVASTVTSRWSSRKDAFNEGTNLHALSRRVRRIFISDPGYVFVNRDLSQAESLCVAYLARCASYKKAHFDGNVHHFVGSKLWPHLGLSKDAAKKTPVPFNPDIMWYDLFKRRQHAGNYMQTPHGFARTAHIPLAEAKKSDRLYFGLFPEIKEWHQEVRHVVQTFHRLTTPMGRVRQFLGRTWSDETIKEAVAHVPQSTVSDINKIILYRIWKKLDPRLAMCLLEVHDSNLDQVRERDVPEFLQVTEEMAKVPVEINGDEMIIGSEVSVGLNWGDYDAKKNPNGLRKVG